ncbi:hypothetical protein E2C01_058041 [Portunus trituberculatus]|uniref:Uncharacterized protein n=1 Tax=Portunus trituberculatus TaxID=210409 RepID=A0A5B7H1L2_PORTR|nr:hypothetical protein [Portunus trituberculatus]
MNGASLAKVQEPPGVFLFQRRVNGILPVCLDVHSIGRNFPDIHFIVKEQFFKFTACSYLKQ